MVKANSLDQQLEIDLPDKKYFTIGEVSEYCQLKSHVLRYWEQVFPQLQPNKRRGRRYYQKRDVALVVEIKSLLHDQGFTISGAKVRLAKGDSVVEKGEGEADSIEYQIQTIRKELKAFQQYLANSY
ncbi:MAG: MerR family transcriptional regulator [Piscirickettsiaceae bacterium CG_4_9_14_3_um_filter_43_564]|nr:MerR family transcriptional regulator [Thiomicrospira sp.]OIP94026.1 MAG: MerR family transcriptional regulator [Thiomicrospira sp. CG2_30_44_34]PIQ05469.1 MAG: MerR family transcriptional regulator [Piscirickettsiaceae bacterium CG18_big_fil_WC_8_21_14_2_50_44_103]PIU39264.1 MAG: MerR family transcriptional regulator [Piscirickettsiaceae bacterium CG07_land_8_20_14_0_80_44_28]PIW58301.1 MAG: MerR family transcriptional regulator [Piscirickettsiaceae bacterium CG12_big_fil_rev_8_21_14_0_65_4